MLTEEQKHLYAIYHKVLTLCSKEQVISKGVFFDLMYTNRNGWRFNEHKQYTFTCKYKSELLFVVISFDNQSANVAINVSSHAFDFLQVPQFDPYKTTDLMTDKEEVVCLLPYRVTEIALGAYTGKILKIKF